LRRENKGNVKLKSEKKKEHTHQEIGKIYGARKLENLLQAQLHLNQRLLQMNQHAH
jgi:hypothetical protein